MMLMMTLRRWLFSPADAAADIIDGARPIIDADYADIDEDADDDAAVDVPMLREDDYYFSL